MRLNDDIREQIKDKYHDGTSDEILRHLKRNFHIYMTKSSFILTPVIYLVINGKSYWVNKNKKYLKNKISDIIEDKFTQHSESVRMRTIKKFLDMVMGLDLS
jgi:hypothetical protein